MVIRSRDPRKAESLSEALRRLPQVIEFRPRPGIDGRHLRSGGVTGGLQARLDPEREVVAASVSWVTLRIARASYCTSSSWF
jgi:hypothetical protein